MLTPVECVCGQADQFDLPEGHTNNMLWECSFCGKRNTWNGPDGPVNIVLPFIPDHITSILDVDEAAII